MTTLTDTPLPLPLPQLLADSPAPLDEAALPTVELVLPVYNEERVLESSVRTLHDHLERHLPCSFQITIADNASTDATLARARSLAEELEAVEVLHLTRKGRGNALRSAWSASRAEVVGYMDIDLSTDLSCLPALLEPLLENRGDIAIGSRLAPGSRVTRGLKRETISRSYNILLRSLLGLGISDAQCGFKAARREAIAPLLKEVRDDGWFFDTELLYLARRNRLAIHEVPVLWVDDPDSRVAIIHTALEDLRGIARLRRGGAEAAAKLPRHGLQRRTGRTRAAAVSDRHRRATDGAARHSRTRRHDARDLQPQRGPTARPAREGARARPRKRHPADSDAAGNGG